MRKKAGNGKNVSRKEHRGFAESAKKGNDRSEFVVWDEVDSETDEDFRAVEGWARVEFTKYALSGDGELRVPLQKLNRSTEIGV